ncbi:MAG: tetratricopeptide repeat protein [Pseudomonadota bacterium]
MSIVNQMLQDLDRRQMPDNDPLNFQRKWSASPKKKRGWELLRHRVPWFTCASLSIAALFILYQQSDRAAEQLYIGDQYVDSGTAAENSVTHAMQGGKKSISDPESTESTVDLPSNVASATALHSVRSTEFHPFEMIGTRVIKANDEVVANPLFAPSHGVKRETLESAAGDLDRNDQLAESADVVKFEQVRHTRLSGVTLVASAGPLEVNSIPLDTAAALDQELNFSIKPAGNAADRSYKLARQHLDGWNTQDAVAELQRTIAFDPMHVAARELLGALLIQQGDAVTAEPLLDTGLTLSPGYSPFAQLKARLQADRGELGAAIDTLKNVKPAQKHRFEHVATLAALYQKNGDHDRASSIYLNLIDAHPNNSSLWSGLAISLDAQGEYEAALKSYKQALADETLAFELRHYAQRRVEALNKALDKSDNAQS